MATINKIMDDLTPDIEASETVVFALDGVAYEIDLSEAHAVELRDFMATYLASGRRLGRVTVARVAGAKPATGPDPKRVRQWATGRGIEVNATGRIPESVIAQYQAYMMGDEANQDSADE